MNKKWYDYLWIFSIAYFILGFFNIIFAWLGLICFIVPLIFAAFGGNKDYCNKYCGRGQLFYLLGYKLKLSRELPTPKWLKSKIFRYSFFIFFMAMFFNMILITYFVFSETKSLNEVLTLFWVFKLPWHINYTGNLPQWFFQFALGFYSMMLTSVLIGFIVMFLYKPRTWCVICPMGTMTQGICKLKAKGK